jgi:hypothetical protein
MPAPWDFDARWFSAHLGARACISPGSGCFPKPLRETGDKVSDSAQWRRSIVTSEQEETAAQKRGAGASGLTPERKAAVQPDGQVASQQTGEVFVDCGAAPFNFDEKNDLNYFVQTITPEGEQRIYWVVSARDQAFVELKREKLAAELNQRNLRNHTVRRR